MATKTKKLTRKQEAFVKHLIEHPKDSATKAALATYGSEAKPITNDTARNISSENLAKPIIKSELAKYSDEVENTLYNTVVEWGAHERPRQREIAQQAAMYIHDKVHGKATQRVETKSEVVSININLNKKQEPTD